MNRLNTEPALCDDCGLPLEAGESHQHIEPNGILGAMRKITPHDLVTTAEGLNLARDLVGLGQHSANVIMALIRAAKDNGMGPLDPIQMPGALLADLNRITVCFSWLAGAALHELHGDRIPIGGKEVTPDMTFEDILATAEASGRADESMRASMEALAHKLRQLGDGS